MRFMVCYEGSAAGKKALAVAREQAGEKDAKLEVVRTITREEPMRHSRLSMLEDELKAEVKDLMEGSEIPYEIQLLVNTLESGEQLVQFAASKKVDQIFIGIKKTSKVGKLVFGSTAQYVILNAPCPVVSVTVSRKRR